MKRDEKESYVFVSSGFYHGLRTFLYPDVDPTDSFEQEIADHVRELEKVLGRRVMDSP